MIKKWINLGVADSLSFEEAQTVRLTNIVAGIPLIAYVFYIGYGIYFDQSFSVLLSASMVILTFIALFINYKGNYGLAKLMLFLLNCTSIWVTYHVFNVDYSVLTSFFPILFCIPLFYNLEKEKLFAQIVFIMVLGAILSSFLLPRQLLFAVDLTDQLAQRSNLFHIILSFLLTVLVTIAIYKNRNRTFKKLTLEREKAEEALGELLKAQSLLLQQEKMASLGVLIAGVSHEINNPLNFIKGSVNGLEAQLKADDQVTIENYSYLIEILNEGVDRLAAIIKSLNHFNHAVPSVKNSCHIKLIVNNCLLIVNHEIKDRIKLNMEVDGDFTVIGNSGQLHQLFLNLITNAIQAMPEKGTLTIQASKSRHTNKVLISDTGHGIDLIDIERIFDPFYTTKLPGKGTGLGLSICYKIMQLHGGKIDVESKKGEGSTFILKFPVEKWPVSVENFETA
uniref:sensor histidine kinase n=1 Tax=Fulvivirga sp. TaxID=1931237 RepID=UPI00404A4D8E